MRNYNTYSMLSHKKNPFYLELYIKVPHKLNFGVIIESLFSFFQETNIFEFCKNTYCKVIQITRFDLWKNIVQFYPHKNLVTI